MQEIFRFWGYDRKAWESWVGPQRLMEAPPPGPSEIKLGRIRFAPEALERMGDFRDEVEKGIESYVLLSREGEKKGKPIVELECFDRTGSLPLVTVDSLGRFRFYFDVDETITLIQQEKYLRRRAPFFLKLGLYPDRFPYHFRKAVLWGFSLSRLFFNGLCRMFFSPIGMTDFSVDVWRFFVRALIEREAKGRYEAVPFWPNGKKFAVVLTHDVDSEWGFKHKNGIEAFREIEEREDLRSAWFVVTAVEREGRSCLQDLQNGGHEIGFHGIRHDHRLAYLSQEELRACLESVLSFFKDFDVKGFRSPGYHRSQALYGALDSLIEYDMTLHDSFENVISPISSYEGCGTCFPFQMEGTCILEIPTTVAEDFVLELKGFSPKQVLQCQLELIQKIKKRQGVANLLTHPEPQLSGQRKWINNYETLLSEIVKDSSAWIPLPRELSRWWRSRQEKINSGW